MSELSAGSPCEVEIWAAQMLQAILFTTTPMASLSVWTSMRMTLLRKRGSAMSGMAINSFPLRYLSVQVNIPSWLSLGSVHAFIKNVRTRCNP